MTFESQPSSRRGQMAQIAEDGPQGLYGQARSLMDACGVTRSRSWLARTVKAFEKSPVQGMPFGTFLAARLELNEQQRRRLAENADLRYLLSYADPTGERAVANVSRERGW